MSFFFFLHNIMNRRFILPVELGNLCLQVFWLSLSQELSPFHLKEALYGFSLAYPNCQHHYSYALGPLLGKIQVTRTQRCDTAAVHPVTQATDPGTRRLPGRELMQHGCVGQMDDSCPRWDGSERPAGSSGYSDCMKYQTTNYFWNIFRPQ